MRKYRKSNNAILEFANATDIIVNLLLLLQQQVAAISLRICVT